MARVSQPIQVTAEEHEALTSILEHADDRMAERIRIILACEEEPSNKKVAAMLGIDEHKVAKWKEAFRNQRIDGLRNASGSGRKAKNEVPDLEASILHLLEDGSRELTVRDIQAELGVSDYQVRKVMREKGISLNRKRLWTYETTDSLSSADIEILGLYISKEACAALTCHSSYGLSTDPGVCTTGNRKLAENLKNAKYKLSVGDAIAEFRYYSRSDALSLKFPEFLQSLLSSLSSFPSEGVGLKYKLFLWSKAELRLKSLSSVPVQFTFCDGVEAFLSSLRGWAGGLTSLAHLYEIEVLTAGIRSYLEGTDPEAFCWKKAVKSVGDENHPIPFKPWIEPKPQISMEEWILKLIQGKPYESEIHSYIISVVNGPAGVNYRVIQENDMMPDPDQFSLTTEAGFLNGMNQLEKAVIKMRDQAGLAEVDLYLDQLKKTKPDRNSERIYH